MLVQWTRREILIHLSQCHPGVRLCLLYFWYWGSKLRFLEMTQVHQWRKMNFSTFIPCFIDHFFFVSDFRQTPCRYFLEFFPLFLHCCLCNRHFQCLRHRNKLVYQVVMTQWIPFAAMWSSWYLCGTPSNRVLKDSSASTIQACLVLLSFPNTVAGFPAAIYWCFYKALLLASEFPTFHERFSWYVEILHHLVHQEDTT